MSSFNYTFVDFLNLIGGINTVKSSVALAPEEARDAQDVDLFPLGGFSKRNGYDPLNPTAVGIQPCTGLFMGHYSLNGGTNIAFLVSGTKLYTMNSSLGGTWSDITGGLSITSGSTKIWNFDFLNDISVLGNGTDTPIQINSSASASALTGGTIPFSNFRFPISSRGYMWYFVPTVSGTTYYDRGYWSDVNSPATFTTLSTAANQFVNVAPGQNGIVTGAVDYKTFLYVFKRHGIHQLSFQPTQVNSSGELFPWIQYPAPVVPGVGTQSHRSIVKFTTPSTHATPGQELVFFVDQFGVPRIFDGSTTISFSSKIGFSRDTSILSLTDMDKTMLPYTFSLNYAAKNKILCFMSTASPSLNTCWILDYTTGFSISRYKYASSFNCGAIFEREDGEFKPYAGDYAGKVMELDEGSTDNGSPINDYYRTGDTFVGSPNIISKWYTLDIRGKNGSDTQKTKVSYFIDGSDAPNGVDNRSIFRPTTLWGAGPPPMIWGQSSWSTAGVTHATFETNLVGKTLGVQIESFDKVKDSLMVEGFSLATDKLGTSVD